MTPAKTQLGQICHHEETLYKNADEENVIAKKLISLATMLW